MADNARDSNDLEKRRTAEAALSARLRRLGDRLGRQRPDEVSETSRGPPAADAIGICARVSAFQRTRGRRAGRCRHRLGARPCARDLAVGPDCISVARLRGRRDECGAGVAPGAILSVPPDSQDDDDGMSAGGVVMKNLKEPLRSWPIRSINSRSSITFRSAKSARSTSPSRTLPSTWALPSGLSLP